MQALLHAQSRGESVLIDLMGYLSWCMLLLVTWGVRLVLAERFVGSEIVGSKVVWQ